MSWSPSTLLFAAAFSLALLAAPAFAGHALSQDQEKLVAAWLAENKTFRMASDIDCDCEKDIQRMRAGYGGDWKPVPDFHPYIVTGDFNGDGVDDFAVVLMNNANQNNNYAIVVFNGPFVKDTVEPAFVIAGLDLRFQAFFYGPPHIKPYRLLVGRFGTEGTPLIPSGATYTLDLY